MEYKLENDMLLEVKHIKKYFPVKKAGLVLVSTF